MIVSLQVLRGVAALLVAVAHLPPHPTVGFFGVDLFFVVSGFVMAHTTRTGDKSPGAFLLRRAVRILPLYWVLTTVAMVSLLHDNRHAPLPAGEWGHLAASYVLLPYVPGDDLMNFYPLLTQGWTLEYEVFFYACLALALWLAPPPRTASVLGVALCALCAAGAVAVLPIPLFQYARTNTLEFVYGMVIARLFARDLKISRALALAMFACAALAACAFAPFSDDWDVLRGFGWGVPAAMAVAGATLSRPFPRGRVSRCFEALGDASYSLYLTHRAAYDAIHAALATLGRVFPVLLTMRSPIMLGGALALAFVTYLGLERPLTRFLQARLLRRPGIVPAALPNR